MLVLCLDPRLPLLPQPLLDLERVQEALKDSVTLFLLLVLIVLLMSLGVMDVMVMVPVQLPVILADAMPESK